MSPEKVKKYTRFASKKSVKIWAWSFEIDIFMLKYIRILIVTYSKKI